MIWLLGTLFVLVCLLLIFMVVITPSNEGGMAAAFGGMGGDSFFGTRGQTHVNRFTVFLAVSFLGLALLINWINSRSTPVGMKGALEQRIENAAPPAPPPPADGLPPGLPPAPPADKK